MKWGLISLKKAMVMWVIRNLCVLKAAFPQVIVQHAGKHFTLLGFTTINRELVLCPVIITGVREIFNIETGIDPSKPVTGNINDFGHD